MNTQIRIGHLSPDTPSVNVVVDGSTVLENVSFRDISDRMDIEAGRRDIAIVPSSGDEPLLEATLDLGSEMAYTVLAIDGDDGIDAMVLADEFELLDTDDSIFRFVHLSPDAPAVDLRVGDDSLLFENVAFTETTEFVAVDIDDDDLAVRTTGEGDVVLSLSDLTLADGKAYTAYVVGTLADDTLDVLLVAEDVTDRVGHSAPTR